MTVRRVPCAILPVHLRQVRQHWSTGPIPNIVIHRLWSEVLYGGPAPK